MDMRKLIPGLVALAVAAIFSIWAYPELPAQVATHFDLHGDPNGWSSRLFASVFVPALGIVLAVVFTVLPRIDPRQANYALFRPTYWTIVNAVLVLLAAVHIFSLGKALGWTINMTRVAGVGVGGLFVLLGNRMSHIRPNWFLGIRTPWTLSSDTVWRKTHRFGGVAFVIAGLCLTATAVVASRWVMYGAVVVAAAAGLSSVVYSYVAWKQEQGTVAPS
jgi:uncharacterized membrane protein